MTVDLVVVGVPDYATALTLTGDEQQQVACIVATSLPQWISHYGRALRSRFYGATLIHIVPPTTYNADTNPSRIRPRNVFDIAVGTDNLWKKDTYSLGAKSNRSQPSQ